MDAFAAHLTFAFRAPPRRGGSDPLALLNRKTGKPLSVVEGLTGASPSSSVSSDAQGSPLGEAEFRYRTLVEHSPDGIVVLVEGRVAFANPMALRIFGAARLEDLVGRRAEDLVDDANAALVAQRTLDIEQHGVATEPLEVHARRLDGSPIEIEVRGMPIQFGGRLADLSVVRDLTEKRRAQEEQAVTRDLVRRMLREVGAEGRALRSLGRALAQELPRRSLADHLHALELMGGGRFVIMSAEQGRYIVAGYETLERRKVATQPTCELPLGFIEGAIARLEGGTALGAETRCQSMGHASCVFVVKGKRS